MKLRRDGFMYILIAGIVGATGYSCKTTNVISVEPKERIKINTVIRHNEKRAEELEGIWIKKISGTLRDETDRPRFFKANYKIKRDSAILISVLNTIGMEGLRVLFTPDSVGFIDRLNKTYYWNDYEGLRRRFGRILSFEDVQAILLNEIVFGEEGEYILAEERSKRVEINNGRYGFGLTKHGNGKNNGFNMYKRYVEFDAFNLNMVRSKIEFEGKDDQLEVDYSDFKEINGIYFPMELCIRMQYGNSIFDCRVTMDRIYIGNDIDISFKISDRYEQIEW